MLTAAVLATGAVTAALMTGGGSTSAAVERSLDPKQDVAQEPDEAALAAPAVDSDTARTAVRDLEIPASLVAAAADSTEPCVVEGVLLLPRGFPAPEGLSLGAWAVGDGASSAPILGAPGLDQTFRFEDVPTGSWTFVARAETEGRIAWGRSAPVTAVPGGHVGGVRVRLEEYVVEGIVTDRFGVPLVGIPVGYGWEGSDEFAGRVLEPPVEENFLDEVPIRSIIGELASTSASELPSPAPSPEEPEAERRDIEAMMRALESAIGQEGSGLVGMGYGGGSEPSPTIGIRIQSPSNDGSSFGFSGGTLDLASGSFSTNNIVFTISPDFNDFGHGSARGETVFTDAAGAFRIALEGPGSVGITTPGVPEEGEREWIPEDQSATVTLEGPSERADFELMRAARIEGHVIRSDADPVSINVFLRRADGGGTQSETTDENGVFKFRELAPGRYLFYARSGGRQGQDFSLHLEIDVSEGGTAVIDDMLTPSSSAIGVVRDSAGQPVAGVRVSARGAINSSLTRSASTNDSGHFEILGMYACDYLLSVNGRKLIHKHEVTLPPQGARVDAGVLAVE
ncbi:MAG: hypothetical protein ACJA2W_004028 [Planctomycetota bacterium]|jgi:hypothetical protein